MTLLKDENEKRGGNAAELQCLAHFIGAKAEVFSVDLDVAHSELLNFFYVFLKAEMFAVCLLKELWAASIWPYNQMTRELPGVWSLR